MIFKIISCILTLALSGSIFASSVTLSGNVGQLDSQTGPISGTKTGTELSLGRELWTNGRDKISIVLKLSRTSVFGELEQYRSNLTSQELSGIQFGGSYTSDEKPLLLGSRIYGDFLVGAGIADIEVQRFHNDNFSVQKSKRNSAILSSATIAALYPWSESVYLKPEVQVAYTSVDLSRANFSFEGEEFAETRLSLVSGGNDDMILNKSKKIKMLQYSIGLGLGFDF